MPEATVHKHPSMGAESAEQPKPKGKSRFGLGVVIGMLGGVGLAYGAYSFAENMVERRSKRLAEQARLNAMLAGGRASSDEDLEDLEDLG